MPFVIPIPQAAPFEYVDAHRNGAFGRMEERVSLEIPESYSGRFPISEIQVGSSRYALRDQATGKAYPCESGGVEFVVEGFGSLFVGHDENATLAYQDWCEKVHAAYQRLIRTRPFEMDDEDRQFWTILESQIDVACYRRTTPIRFRQVGRADYCKTDRPRRISWSDGHRDDVSLFNMPAAFASLRPNQWFEAVVLRDPLSGELRKVLDLEPIPALRLMSTDEQTEFLRSLPVGALDAPPGDERSDARNREDRS